MKKHLAELYSRKENKSIPLFLGSGDDRLVADWIRDAERVAESNDWTAEQKVKYFSDRLKDDAVEWHISHLETNSKDDYVSWKLALLGNFSGATDLENLRRKLTTLKQNGGQRVKAVTGKIDSLYDRVHGKAQKVTGTSTAKETVLINNIKQLRDQEKRDILMKGLLKKFSDQMYGRMKVNDTYEELCDLAYTVENVTF